MDFETSNTWADANYGCLVNAGMKRRGGSPENVRMSCIKRAHAIGLIQALVFVQREALVPALSLFGPPPKALLLPQRRLNRKERGQFYL